MKVQSSVAQGSALWLRGQRQILARKGESKGQKLIYSLACTRAQHFEIVTEITTAAIGTRIQILGKEVCSLILWASEEFRFSLFLLSFCWHFCLLKYPAPALYWSGLVTCQSPTGVTVTSQKTPAWWILSLLPAPGPCCWNTLVSHCSYCWLLGGTRRARGWGHTLRAASLEWQPSQFGFSKNSCLQTLITVLAQHSEWFF